MKIAKALMRSGLRAYAGSGLAISGVLGMVSYSAPADAKVTSDVSIAAVAVGRLYVIGTTEKPNTVVTLDKRFQTTSDPEGHYVFEEIYHPANCIVGIDIEARTYRAVVSNCAQQPSIGTLPFVNAELPPLPLKASSSPPKPEPAHAAKLKPRPRPAPARAPTKPPVDAAESGSATIE